MNDEDEVWVHDIRISPLAVSQVLVVAEVALTDAPSGTSLLIAPQKIGVDAKFTIVAATEYICVKKKCISADME